VAQGLMEKIVNVKRKEWRLLSWLLLFFFFESIGTEIMDILAVSTFLKEAGIRNLPLVYIFDEVLLAFFLVLYGMVVDRFDRAKFVNYLQIGFAAALIMLFAAIKAGAPAAVISVLIYVLKSLIISVLEEAFWLMNDDLYDVQRPSGSIRSSTSAAWPAAWWAAHWWPRCSPPSWKTRTT